METHIVEILALLMTQYPDGAIRPEDFEPLTRDLIHRGYSEQEIETALFWYHSRQVVEGGSPSAAMNPESHRVLHEVERAVLTPEAYGYLLGLLQLGVINLGEMDAIIDRAVLIGGRKVDVDGVKMFVAAQIMDSGSQLPRTGQSFYLKTPPERIQ